MADEHVPAVGEADAASRAVDQGHARLALQGRSTIVRMATPLDVSDEELDRGLEILDRALMVAAS